VVEAGGQRQWVQCAGTGGPTILLISGLGADHRMWSSVVDRLAETRRTCIVDRPGLGSSPDRVGRRTVDAGVQARELRAALAAVGERGPFVLVAHSYGGLIARALVQQDPSSAAALLLLEAVWPGIERDFLPSYASPWHEAGTTLDIVAGSRAARGPLPAIPVLVIVAGRPENGASRADAIWRAHQKTAAREANGHLWTARRSGHVVQRDQPGIVIRGVRHLLTMTTSGS
jgi:pimeloyl-ACP methyl ester carboxylesterase